MKKFVIFILINCFAFALYAGDESRKGTTGADHLLIPVGARGIATGGAFVAFIDGIESIYYNPAGLDVTSRSEAMFSYMNYIADINVSYFAASASLGDLGSIGLSLKSLDFGEIPVTTAEFPDGNGSTYSPVNMTLGLTYSKVLTDRISIGTNIKLINESIENTSANGLAIDFGVQYKFNSQLSIGAALKNVGPNMRYSGPDMQTSTSIPGSFNGTGSGSYEIVSEEFQIPSFFELSFAFAPSVDEQNSIIVASTFTANNALEDKINFGFEYGFMNNFFARFGYNLSVGSETNKSIYGFSAGAGVQYELVENTNLVFDYAYRDVKDFPTSNHIFTVKLAFQ